MAGSAQYDAVVVGAGFAGLYMLHRLRGPAHNHPRPAGRHPRQGRANPPGQVGDGPVEKCDEVAAKGYEGFSPG